MTTMTTPEAIVSKTRAARAQAVSLLEVLHEAKLASEQRLVESSRPDPLKQVTGRSSLENAIEATRHMIEMLDRNLVELDRGDGRLVGRTNGCVVVPRASTAATVSA